jgi:hypothetical protein
MMHGNNISVAKSIWRGALLVFSFGATGSIAQSETAQVPAACSSIPATLPSTSNAALPDPFTFLNGTRVTTKDAWACRREELKALFQHYELGPKPPKPSSVTATLSGTTITITCSQSGKSISFAPTIKYPTTGTAPYPAIIALVGGSIPQPAGVAMISYNVEEIAPDDPPHGVGKFFDLYGSSSATGGLMAWAWGASRIIDALEILSPSASKIDVTRIGVTGCSRDGKGAMVAGAFDDRIKLTIPQEGGSGSAGCWRIVDEMKKNGTTVENAAQIVNGDQWFTPSFSNYVNIIPTLPYDHHELVGIVAPRGLLVIENSGIDYLGPISTYGGALAGRLIYQALSVKTNGGFSQVSHGSSHCSFQSSQQGDLTAFVNKFLLGQNSTSTDVFKTDKNYNFDQNKWIPWQSTVPTLT